MLISALISNSLYLIDSADFSNDTIAIYIASLLFWFYGTTIISTQCIELFGSKLSMFVGSCIACAAMGLTTQIFIEKNSAFWPTAIIGIFLNLLLKSVNEISLAKETPDGTILRISRYPFAALGVLIGGACVYYTVEEIGVAWTLRALAIMCFLCFMTILFVVKDYTDPVQFEGYSVPSNKRTFGIYLLVCLLSGVCAWVPIIATFVVALLFHDSGLEYATWQFIIGMCANLIAMPIFAFFIDEKDRTSIKLLALCSIIIGVCIWIFTVTDVHVYHGGLTLIAGSASGMLSLVPFVNGPFFIKSSRHFVTHVGELSFAFGIIIGIGVISMATADNTYLRYVTLASLFCTLLSAVFLYQPSESYSEGFRVLPVQTRSDTISETEIQ